MFLGHRTGIHGITGISRRPMDKGTETEMETDTIMEHVLNIGTGQ